MKMRGYEAEFKVELEQRMENREKDSRDVGSALNEATPKAPCTFELFSIYQPILFSLMMIWVGFSIT